MKAADNTPAVFARELSELEKLKKTHAQLVAHCTKLEERLALYASVINVLVLEKEAGDSGAHIPDLEAWRRKRQAAPSRSALTRSAAPVGVRVPMQS